MKVNVISNFFKSCLSNSPMRQMGREFHTIYCYNFFGGEEIFLFLNFCLSTECLPFRELSEMNKIYADFIEGPHKSSSHEVVPGPGGYKGGSIKLL